MSKGRSIAAFLAIVLLAAPRWATAQTPPEAFSFPSSPIGIGSPGPLSSPMAADRFLDIGYELAHAPNITGPEADQAIILLTAAKSLDSQAAGVEPLLLRLATRHSQKDYSEPVIFWLQKYVDQSADRVLVADAVQYLLRRTATREERKALLERVAAAIRNKNAAVDSDLATSLGLLMLEQQDVEKAKWYLVQAYNNNKFNRTAFAKLTELAPNEVGPATYLEHLRLLVRENPLDLNAALTFAAYAERLQIFDVAAQSYQYAAELFRYLYPSEPLPPTIYLPWAISCYNTVEGRPICVQIAENIRTLGRFDILLEAIAGKAAVKMGKLEEARQIFREAAHRAQELLLYGNGPLPDSATGADAAVRPPNAKQLAWFYCFADPNAAQALDWANRAYAAEPNSPSAGALLAYALCINNRLELAKPLLAAAEQSQIAELVQAWLQVSVGNKSTAVQILRSSIARDAGSLVAEKAKDLLRQLGSEYAPPIEIRPVVAFLVERLGRAVVPQFTPPDKMMDVQFEPAGKDFSYGNEIEGVVTITNQGAEPLIITDNSLFQGNLRVSARVAGDITRDIPNLVFETLRTDLAVPPGRSLIHRLRLSTGALRDLLVACPQAALDLQFTLYLDPVTTGVGETTNRLVDLKPLTISVKRPGLQVTGELVRSRLNALASASEARKVQTARLFTGLLKEQQLMADKALYAYQYAEWLPGQLRLALTSPYGVLLDPKDRDWAVRISTMADMLYLSLDQELAAAVAKNLTHPYWPVRLMTVYLLARSPAGGFESVLDWVASNDPDEMVRGMASSLLAGSSAGAAPQLLSMQPASAILP
jgi:hypothetical protein